MSIFKAALSPFFELEPNEDKKPQVPVQSVPVAPSSPQVPKVTLVAEVDPKVHDFFSQLLANKNGPGYDYFEHSQTIENLKTTIPDQVTRVKTAVVLAQTMGSSKPAILESAKGYLKHLEDSLTEFSKGHQAKVAELETKGANLEAYNKKIFELQEEIRKLEVAKSVESSEIKQKTDELETVSSKFETSYKIFKSKIEEDVNDINRFA